jgi:hypothetical protein
LKVTLEFSFKATSSWLKEELSWSDGLNTGKSAEVKVADPCNPSTWEAEAGGSQVRSQAGIQSKTLLKKENKE